MGKKKNKLPSYMNKEKIREIFNDETLTDKQCRLRYQYMCYIFKHFGTELKSWEDFENFMNYFDKKDANFPWAKNYQCAVDDAISSIGWE